MTDEELRALVERLEQDKCDPKVLATMSMGCSFEPCECEFKGDAASAIRQLMKERDEAREAIRDLSRRAYGKPEF